MHVFLWIFQNFYHKQNGAVSEWILISVNGNIRSRICCNIFGQLYFWKIYFFTVFSKYHKSYFFGAALSSEQMTFLRSSFIKTVTFSIIFSPEHLLVQSETSTQKTYLENRKFFSAVNHRRHLQKSYFFEAGSSAQHQLFQKKARFWKRLLFQKSEIPHYLLFLESYLLISFSSIATFYSSYIFRRASFLQHTFSEELLFHRYPSFPQLHFLLTNH